MWPSEKLKQISDAKQQIVTGSLTIWNARLESLANAGNLNAALEELLSPVEAVARRRGGPVINRRCPITNVCSATRQAGELAGLSSTSIEDSD